jgi:hypothetical protein
MSSPPLTPPLLKRALVEAGFEIFRTKGDEVVLAERVRENLIMDSGVRLRAGTPLEVHLVFRAQRAEFPNEDETQLFERVRALATVALANGFRETASLVSPVHDPVDPNRTLDIHYEVTFVKQCDGLEAAVAEVTFGMKVEKTAAPRPRQPSVPPQDS